VAANIVALSEPKTRVFHRSVTLEVLHGALVRFRFLARGERSQVSTLTRLGVLLAGVQAVFSGRQFSDHAGLDDRFSAAVVRLRAKKNLIFPVCSCAGRLAVDKILCSSGMRFRMCSISVQL
jgi:hypothetical protein